MVNAKGHDLRRALFSLKRMFQVTKHNFNINSEISYHRNYDYCFSCYRYQ